MRKLFSILHMNYANESYKSTSQSILGFRAELDNSPPFSVEYYDSGNNAEYEAECVFYRGCSDTLSQDDMDLIEQTLIENDDKIFEGSKFILDYDKQDSFHLRFTKLLEEK